MIARLKVTPALAESSGFRLPPGYVRGEERYNAIERVIEMNIEGQFDPSIMPTMVDSSSGPGQVCVRPPYVTAIVTRFPDRLEWQWRYDEGANVGAPIAMELPAA